MNGRLLYDPVAVTSKGLILVNVAYVEDVDSVEQMLALLKSKDFTGRLFLGITLGPADTLKALKAMDDFSAELAAVSSVGHR